MNSDRLSGCCRMISAPVTAWTFAGTCAAGTPKPGRGVTPMTSMAGVSSCSAGFSAQTAPRASAKPARDRISDAPVKSRFRIALLFQARDVMREILDVLLGDGLGDAGHAAGIVGARARLEVFQLKVEIAGGLAREHRKLSGRRVSVGAMAGGAGFGLALALSEIGVRRREESEEKAQGENPFHPAPQKIKGRPRAASQDRNDQGRANTTTLLPRLKSICVFPPAATATYCLFFTM